MAAAAKVWSKKEISYLKKHYGKLTNQQIATDLQIGLNTVRKKAENLGLKNVRWKETERIYLKEKWGYLDIDTLSKNLKKDTSSIKRQVKKMNLGSAYDITGEFISIANAAKILGKKRETLLNWAKKYEIKVVKTDLDGGGEISLFVLENFISFLRKNPQKWDASKIDLYGLGGDPQWISWLKLKKVDDLKKSPIKVPWTTEEEFKLVRLHKKGYTPNEIMSHLPNRTESAISNHISFLRKQDRWKKM